MIFVVNKLPDQYLAVIHRVDQVRAQLQYAIQVPRRWVGVLRRSTFARAIQGSNSIEGYNVTLEDAVAAVERQAPIDTESEAWLAITGYREAMTYILQLADDPYFTYSEGLIRSLHYMMLNYNLEKHPGRWRPGPVFVRREPTGEIVYEGPDVGLVPILMRELIDSLNARNELPALVRPAMGHLNLVMIHPFSDGNGRMGRALQTLVLARGGILSPHFCSIEEYLGRNTQEYYSVLADVGRGNWHPERDPLLWLRFCLTAHYRQAETLLRRTKETERLWSHLEVEIANRKLPERVIFALADAAFGWRIYNSTYRSAAEISENLASRDLKLLVDQELLRPVGERRGRSYAATPVLRAMREQAREPKHVTDPFAEVVQEYLPGFAPGSM